MNSEKVAIVIGVNYTNSPSNALSGCINDANNIKSCLLNRFGFVDGNITMLLESAATLSQIMTSIYNAVMRSRRGSVSELWISFSGHGSYVTDTNSDETDGRDETIVPYDFTTNGMITDDMIRQALSGVSPSTSTILLFDSCHSGTMADLKYRYVGTGNVTENSSAQFGNKRIIAISGCRDDQVSSDAYGLEGPRTFSGAMTSSFLASLTSIMESQGNPSKTVTIKQLIDAMRAYLVSHNFDQVPQITSSLPITDMSIFCGNRPAIGF